MTILELSEKLERLTLRLPEPLRKPLLREITPVKEIFLKKRSPRLLLVGSQGVEEARLINLLLGGEAEPIGSSYAGDWNTLSRPGHGVLRWMDARNPASINRAKSALERELPDLIIFAKSEAEAVCSSGLDYAETLLDFIAGFQEGPPPLIGVLVQETSRSAKAVQDLREALQSKPALKRSLIETLPVWSQATQSEEIAGNDRPTNANPFTEAVAFALPNEAKLEMARLSGVRSAQMHIAQILVRSMSAAAGAIGAQPIPLADFPILTFLQALMVSGIMVVSGRTMSKKLAAEFIAALGFNIGAGLFLREGARAALKLLPGWGNAISGAIASAGTYAIGRSASAYFIEGASLSEARKLFRRFGKSAIEKKRIGR